MGGVGLYGRPRLSAGPEVPNKGKAGGHKGPPGIVPTPAPTDGDRLFLGSMRTGRGSR
jgi:hypothetical protein